MDIHGDKSNKYNTSLLRGWQRSQLKLLKEFATNNLVSQTKLSGASGYPVGSHELGGKITALSRAELIQKAGKDENGQSLWQLNEDKVDRESLLDILEKMQV